MRSEHVQVLVAILLSVFGLSIIVWWLAFDPTKDFKELIPGMDNRQVGAVVVREEVAIGEIFEVFEGKPANLPGSWPRFRGSAFDNISHEYIGANRDWTHFDPGILWSVELGEGYAAPVVKDGRIYLLDYNEEKRADVLRCFSLDDGEEIWRRGYHVHVKRNHGMSRTIPAVSDGFVVTMGPKCHVMCVHTENGDFLWGMDLEKIYSTEVPFWYTGQCPLIDQSVAVIAPCGSSLMIGVECRTGEVLWETPNVHGWKMSHSSVIEMTFGGKKMYVYCGIGGILGVSAEEADRGQVIWESSEWNPTVVAPSPVILDGGKIFMTAGYGAGSMLLQLREENGKFSASVLETYKPKEGFASEQQTPIYYNNHLYGILPKDGGVYRNQFVCCNPGDLRTFVWTSGKTNRFGLGPFILVDGFFFILNDDGTLTVAEASTDAFKPLAQVQLFEGQDAWGPIAVAGNRMLLRDSRKMVCIGL